MWRDNHTWRWDTNTERMTKDEVWDNDHKKSADLSTFINDNVIGRCCYDGQLEQPFYPQRFCPNLSIHLHEFVRTSATTEIYCTVDPSSYILHLLPVRISVSLLSLQLCLSLFMFRSLHPIEVVGITTEERREDKRTTANPMDGVMSVIWKYNSSASLSAYRLVLNIVINIVEEFPNQRYISV